MPVILCTNDEIETWLTAPPDQALQLQRPLPNGSLVIVGSGTIAAEETKPLRHRRYDDRGSRRPGSVVGD